jgi:hypothetical protein
VVGGRDFRHHAGFGGCAAATASGATAAAPARPRPDRRFSGSVFDGDGLRQLYGLRLRRRCFGLGAGSRPAGAAAAAAACARSRGGFAVGASDGLRRRFGYRGWFRLSGCGAGPGAYAATLGFLLRGGFLAGGRLSAAGLAGTLQER